jgi:1-acyl-sn-glycerol-3-phosphate acyltransferase
MNLLRKIWAIYGLLVFFLMWLILIPFILLAFFILPESGHRHLIWFFHHVYTRLYFFLTLTWVKINGRQLLDYNQSYIIVSNHVSDVDFMLNAMAFPKAYKYLAKKELTQVPIFGLIVRRLCVLVDRGNAESRRKSIQYLQKTMKEGYSIFLYPEGTRNQTDELLQPFQKGAFRLAIQTGTPIAVQTIVGIERISGKGAYNLLPGVVDVVWSKPIETTGLELKDLPKLMEKVRGLMLKNLEN